MLDLAQISQAVENYQSGRWSLDEFADWLLPISRQKFSAAPEVLASILRIDSLLSQVYFDGLPESVFQEELAKTAIPFASRGESPREVVVSELAPHIVPALVTAMALSLVVAPNVSRARSTLQVRPISQMDGHTSSVGSGVATEPKRWSETLA